MLDLFEQIEAAVVAIRKRSGETPRVGIILGTGLGGLAEQIESPIAIDYEEIPNFPRSTAVSHRGRLVCGNLEGVPIVAMEGRFHQYEGYPLKQITLPVRVMKALGAETMIVTQAVGGMNPLYRAGDVMIIDDQINLMGDNPLVGVNDDRLGPRFPDMSAPYDAPLMEIAVKIARQHDWTLHRGVYVAMLGPTYETRAEYRMARRMGGDVVGMSTVPEVVTARHAGMCVLGLSTITNVGSPDTPSQTSGHDVLAAAATAADKLTKLVRGVVGSLAT